MLRESAVILLSCVLLFSLSCSEQHEGFYIDTKIEDVLYVNNLKPLWDDNQKIELEFVRQIGGLDATDEDFMLFGPRDVNVDDEGNIYVFDVGNKRIQKYNADGEYMVTFGHQGEGPGEFNAGYNFDIGPDGHVYLMALRKQKIIEFGEDGLSSREFHVEGMPTLREFFVSPLGMGLILSTTLGEFYITPDNKILIPDFTDSALIKMHDNNGTFLKRLGEKTQFEDEYLKRRGNDINYTVDEQGNIYVTFNVQNRIEKYSPDGKLMMRIDRPLNIIESTEVEMVRKFFTAVNAQNGQMWNRPGEYLIPNVNWISSAIAVDHNGNIWVETYRVQPDLVESLTRNNFVHFEVFDKNGVLLGYVPLPRNSDIMKIYGDRLFLVDPRETMSVYEYRIVEK